MKWISWRQLFACVTLFIMFVSCCHLFATEAQPVLAANAVAVADKYSAIAAKKIFKQGGNAVDAAVAIAFTLAVTYPEAGNIGGGGFMTLYINQKPYFLDYRERAPSTASKDMYLDIKKDVIPSMSLYGIHAIAVPGTVAGMWAAHQRFGKLAWDTVLAPAIDYAEPGFVVSKALATARKKAAVHFKNKTNFDNYFANLIAGKVFKQPELAETLKRIAKNGASDFYQGKTADLIIATTNAAHGLITKNDLEDYKPIFRAPLLANWHQFEIITAPPPSSGGIGLIQLLKMKADLNTKFKDLTLNSAQYIHQIAEIEKRVFADRAEYLGDPDFYPVPVKALIADDYLMRRAQEINLIHPSLTKTIIPGLTSREKPQTTHYSVIDRWGNAVSNTYTLNGNFGSGVVVEGAGFLLNDEMDDFSIKPGVMNMFGVIGNDANAIQPKKRPLSSMTPTIITQNGKVVMVIGTPGGSRIFTSIFQVLTNVYDFNMSLSKAVTAMRFHHQLLPANTIFMEPYKSIQGALAHELQEKGYILQLQDFNSDIQVIKISQTIPESITDPRGRGVAEIIYP